MVVCGNLQVAHIEKKIIFEISSKDKTISGLKDRVKDFKTIKAADDVASFHFVPLNQLKVSEFGLDSIRKGISIFLKEREI